MWRFKIIAQSLKKQGIRYKLVFFQLVIVFIALNCAFILINKSFEVKRNVNKLIDENKGIRVGLSISSKCNNPYKTINEIYEKLKKNDEIKKVGSYYVDGIRINELKDANDLTALYLDKGAFDLYNIKVNKGSKDIFQYQNKNEIPVLISSDLGKRLDVNNIINAELYSNNNFKKYKFKVVGVISKNTFFWSGRSKNDSPVESLNKTIIIPFGNEYFYDDMINFNMKGKNTVIVSKESNNTSAVISDLVKLRGNGIEVRAIKVSSIVDQVHKNNKQWIVMLLTFAILLIILSFIGFTGIVTSYIVFRKKEYGIRFALGSTKRELLALISGEIITSLVVTNIIAFLFIILINYLARIKLSKELIILSIVPALAFSCMMICITLVIYKFTLHKKNIVDLVRGK